MVKRIISLVIIAAALCFALCSCGGNGGEIVLTNDSASNTGTASTQPATEESFWFNTGRVSIKPHGDFANAEPYLGEPVSKEVSASCAYIGYDKVFVYSGFTVQTYPEGDRDYILWISVTDPDIKTPEGISIGSTEAEVRAAYGDSYEARGNAWVYRRGDASLSLVIADGRVAAIQYMAE